MKQLRISGRGRHEWRPYIACTVCRARFIAPGCPVIEKCALCHGMDGSGRGNGAFPKIAGQRPDYLFASLKAFAKGERNSGIMEPIASELSMEKMQKLANYYA